MTEIIFATKNKGKIKEIQNLLGDEFKIKPLSDIKIDIHIEEDGKTFEENSLKKAIEVMKVTNKIVMADDSGLEIDFLNKDPGVQSSRFMGEDTPYTVKNNAILQLLKDVSKKNRTARFVSVITAAFPNGEIITTKGVIEGFVHTEVKGEGGFCYDPIFYIEEMGKTMAELTIDEKNQISHRGKAFEKMKFKLYKKLNINL